MSMDPFHINPSNLDFALPKELIAQEALPKRDQARLMVLNRQNGSIEHARFRDLPQYLIKGDSLVLNRARVNPAKLWARKESGGKLEVIFLGPQNKNGHWNALIKPFLKEGTKIIFDDGKTATLVGRTQTGENILDCKNMNPHELMEKNGVLPLPPYIKRIFGDSRINQDRADYQTVFADTPGSVAAPTAGLHFSEELLQECLNKGVQIHHLVLHVGWGTFRPISNTLEKHEMLSENFEIPGETWEKLKEAKKMGKRIIGVGTTSTRALESLSPDQKIPLPTQTNIFIRPGFKFQWLSGLITNFHVPRSTPISLTAAFAGLPFLSRAYEAAILKKYRFFSYGDAMLIL